MNCSIPVSTSVAEPVQSQPLVDARNLRVRLGRTQALAGLSLQVAAGERVAVIGPSGAGKTTLFRTIAGLVVPDAGRLQVMGAVPSRLRGRILRQWRSQLGMLYQKDNLIPQLRVVHNVLLARTPHWSLLRALWSLLWPQELDAARRVLAAVELEDRLWALPDALSGGQQQRVAIARLMLQQPRLMLADEPINQLDVRLGRELIGQLLGLATHNGATLLVNLHGLDLLDAGFDRVVALRDGQVLWEGGPAELTRQRIVEIYGADHPDRMEGVAAAGALAP